MANYTFGDTEQIVSVVDMICEGPIYGLSEGKASIYLNDVPVENIDYLAEPKKPGTVGSESSAVTNIVKFTSNADTSGDLLNFTLDDSEKTVVLSRSKYLILENYAEYSIDFLERNEQYQLDGFSYKIKPTTTGGFSTVPFSGTSNTTLSDNYLFALLVEEDATSTFIVDGVTYKNYSAKVIGEFSRVSNDNDTGYFLTKEDAELKGLNVDGDSTDLSANTKLLIAKAFSITNFTEDDISLSSAPGTGSYRASFTETLLNEPEFSYVGPLPSMGGMGLGSSAYIYFGQKKVNRSTYQFRRGSIDQAPLVDVGGLGAINIPGTGPTTELKQPTDANFTAVGEGLTSSILLDQFGYPDGSSRDASNGKIVKITSEPGSSLSFNLTDSQALEVDEVSIRITYDSLVTYNTEDGKQETCHGIYLFQIKTYSDFDGSGNLTPSDWKTLFSNSGGQVIHAGRTTAPVSFDHIIGLNRFRPFVKFEIRIVRLTRHQGVAIGSDGSNLGKTDKTKYQTNAASVITSAGLSSAINEKLSYPYTSLVGQTFSSKTYDSMPSRSYLLKGLKVRIPTNYTPREYSTTGVATYEGFWDGSMSTTLFYTDNPAWVFYDIVTNNRYGIGSWVNSNLVDRYSLYRIARYCDELVPSGLTDANGDDILEPRFRANLFLTKATSVYKVLKDMASIFTGMLYWFDNKLTVIQDVPAEPIYTFSKSNVIDGAFEYQSTGEKTRVNQVIVTWNDPKSNYEPVPLIVEDRAAIVKAGKLIPQSAVAFGATSEGQALRYGRWKLWTAQNQTEIVNFKTGLQGSYVRPGDIINVQDADRYGPQYSGRVRSASKDAADVTTIGNCLVVLDRNINSYLSKDAGNTYKISFIETQYAAFYTGLDPITLNGSGHETAAGTTYNRGDRITTNLYVYENGAYRSVAINTEARASNAFYEKTGAANEKVPLSLAWKKYTHVREESVVLASINTDTDQEGTIRTKLEFAGSSINTNISAPSAGSIWSLFHTQGEDVVLGSEKEYKVLSVGQEELNEFQITAVEHYNTKYDAVDKDYLLGLLPTSTYPEQEDPGTPPPAPSAVYVELTSDSTQPGEEFVLRWEPPMEEYDVVQNDGTTVTRKRQYQYLSGYEIFHNIPGVPNPISTVETFYPFSKVPDDLYIFRVRSLSTRGNRSVFKLCYFEVTDIFSKDVPRVPGGIPQGIISSEVPTIGTASNGLNSVIKFTDSPAYVASLANPLNVASFTSQEFLIESLPLNRTFSIFKKGNAITGGTYNTDKLSNVNFWNLTNDPEGDISSSFYYHGKVNLPEGSNELVRNPSTGNFGSYASGFPRRTVLASNTPRLRDILVFHPNVGNGDLSFQEVQINSIDLNPTGGNGIQLAMYTGVEGDNTEHHLYTGDQIFLDNFIEEEFNEQGEVERFTTIGQLIGVRLYVKRISSQIVELYKSYDIATDTLGDPFVGTGANPDVEISSGFSYRANSGTIRMIGALAAKVTASVPSTRDVDENNNYVEKLLLDRTFPFDITDWHCHRHTTRWDYDDDALFGKVTRGGTNVFSEEFFFILNENLNKGKSVSVVLSPGVLLYDAAEQTEGQGNNLQTSSPDNITAKATAIGFLKPQFRIKSLSAGLSSSALTTLPETTWRDPSAGSFDITIEVDDNGSVAYRSGTEESVVFEVREKEFNTTDVFEGEGFLYKTTSGSDGVDGKTVFLEAEDYTVIYNVGGRAPSYNGSNSQTIQDAKTLLLTATQKNFTSAKYKFTLIDPGPANLTGFAPASNSYSTFDSSTFIQDWSTSNSARVQIPDNFSSFQGTTSRFTGTIQVKVEVIEAPTGGGSDSGQPILASDTITISGIRSTENGIWTSLSNEAHTIVADQSGIPVGDGPSTVSGRENTHVISNNSGTTIEVGKGRSILTYVPHEDVVTVPSNVEVWGKFGAVSGQPRVAWDDDDYLDKWTINEVTAGPQTDSILVSVPAAAGTDKILTIPAHEFKKSSFDNDDGDTAVVQYSILVEEDTTPIERQQSFSKSKTGFSGVSIVQKNQFESLPSDKNGRVKDLSLSGNSINVFAFGINLPWYSDETNIPSGTTSYWLFTQNPTISETNGTADGTFPTTIINTGSASEGDTGYIDIAPLTTVQTSVNTITVSYNILVSLSGSEETFTVSQTLTKTKNNANISAISNVNHYLFDGDSSTPTPNSAHTITVSTLSPEGVDEYITIQGGSLTTEQEFISSGNSANNAIAYVSYLDGSGNNNYPRTYTLRLYDWDGTTDSTLSNALTAGSAVLLDTDTITISASRSPKDNVVLELDNDNETVGGKQGSNYTSNVISNATVYLGGIDDTSNWNFSHSSLPAGVTASTATGKMTTTSTLGASQLLITSIASTFTSGTITITASKTGYSNHTAVFTLTRNNSGVGYSIVPSVKAVTYNPNTETYNPTNGEITFSLLKIHTEEETTSETTVDYYYKIGAATTFTYADTADGGVAPVYKFSDPNADGDTTDKITSASNISFKAYIKDSNNVYNLVDEESIPLIIGGEDGSNAKSFFVSPSHQIVVKNAAGTSVTPTAVEFTHSKSNMGTGNPTWSSASALYAAATGGSALSGSGLTRSSVYVRPSVSDTSVTVEAALSFDGTTLSDTESVEVVQDGATGADAIIVSLSNDNVTLTAASNGAVASSAYAGSGTDISVYEGATKLSYDTTSPQPNGTWTVSESGSSITPDSTPAPLGSSAPYDARYGNATGMPDAATSATITFTITGKTADGTSFTATKVQTFSKSKQGTAGNNPGIDIVFTRVASGVTPLITSGTTSNPPASTNASWQTTIPSAPTNGGTFLWAADGTRAAGGTSWSWGTPYRVEAPAAAELVIYSDKVTGTATKPSDGTSTYNFKTSTLTINDDNNWFASPPANLGNGEKIYVTNSLVTGSPEGTQVPINWNTPVVYAQRTDGVSVTSTQEYYQKTSTNATPNRYLGSSGTTINLDSNSDGIGGWVTSPIQPDSTYKYLWNFNRNTKSDNSTEDTNVILLTQTVKSIQSITEAYKVHNSSTSEPTGTWYSTISAAVTAQAITDSYPYLWNRTTIAYTDGSASTVVYSLIAVKGTDGTNGTTPVKGTDYDDGVDGVAVSVNPSVASVTYFYDGALWDPSVTSATVKVLTTGLSSVSYSWGSSSGTGTGATRTISFSSNIAEASISGQSASGSVTVSGTKSDGTSYSSGALSWSIPAIKAARGAKGDDGGPGFFKITRTGGGTATGSAGSQLGPPSTNEVSEPTTNSAAIVQNDSGQKAYVYSGTAWTLTTLIDTGVIAASAITTTLLDANAVTTDKIFAGAVTTGKIDADAVTAEKLEISNSTGASTAGINMNYNNGNPKIEISDGTGIRVVLGYLGS